MRTFQTAYDADGRVMHFGENSGRRLRGMHRHADHLRRQWTAARKDPKKEHKVARALHEKWRKYLDKITRRVRALHEQTATWLLQHYRVILVSNMETSKMVRRERRLHPTTRREMLQLAHYRFRQLLVSMARRKPWCRVIEVGEDYTTQTCGKCGKLHKEIGSDKTFCCPQSNCDFTCDRDVNGARNILLRYLTTQKIAVPPGLARLSGAMPATASAATSAPPGQEGPATAGVRQALSSDARQPAAPEQEASTPAPPASPPSNRRPFRHHSVGIAASGPHWSSHALEGHEVVYL